MRKTALLLCRGIGQVFFQDNALSGALMLAAIACNSWQQALMALLGNFAGVQTGRLAHYPDREIRAGIYGFNGTLVGIATGVFLQPGLMAVLLLLAGAVLSTWLTRLFSRQHLLPGYTAPFILTVWLLLALCHWLFPTLLLPAAPIPSAPSPDFIRAFSLHFGQVMFQGDTILCGLLLLAGILVNSPINAAYAVWGALLPLAVCGIQAPEYAAFNAGLLGYNGVLCAIALGGSTLRSALWATLAILLSTALQVAGLHWELPTLTAPFVLSTWAILAIRHVATQKIR